MLHSSIKRRKKGGAALDVKRAFFLIVLLIFMSGCAALQNQGNSAGNEPQEFENTKEMVIDVLKTEDGKAALEEVLTDEDVQESILMEQDFVQDTVQTTLTSEDGQQYFQQVMQQPDFQQNIATSMQQENEELLKRFNERPGISTDDDGSDARPGDATRACKIIEKQNLP